MNGAFKILIKHDKSRECIPAFHISSFMYLYPSKAARALIAFIKEYPS